MYLYLPKLRVPHTKTKLQASWHGPYIVSSVVNKSAVHLRRISDGKFLKKSVPVERLKMGHMRAEVNAWDPIPHECDIQDPELITHQDLPDNSFTPINDKPTKTRPEHVSKVTKFMATKSPPNDPNPSYHPVKEVLDCSQDNDSAPIKYLIRFHDNSHIWLQKETMNWLSISKT